jgi:hypothetical protein
MDKRPAAAPRHDTQTRQQRGPDSERGERHGPTTDPRLPHEHDESSDSQQPQGRDPMVERAAADVAAGRQDTTKATELDRTYQRQKHPG